VGVLDRNLGRTNKPLWFFSAACVFVPLGFIEWVGFDKGNHSYWGLFALLTTIDKSEVIYLLIEMAVLSVVLLLPAASIGWVIHAIVVSISSLITGGAEFATPENDKKRIHGNVTVT
jgi:hypothetical protein